MATNQPRNRPYDWVLASEALENGDLEQAGTALDRAEAIDPANAEAAALRAIYAYEEALSYTRGKRIRATGTWQLVNRHGLLTAVRKRLQSRNGDNIQPVLAELGMEDYSFSAVEAAFPDAFLAAAA